MFQIISVLVQFLPSLLLLVGGVTDVAVAVIAAAVVLDVVVLT